MLTLRAQGAVGRYTWLVDAPELDSRAGAAAKAAADFGGLVAWLLQIAASISLFNGIQVERSRIPHRRIVYRGLGELFDFVLDADKEPKLTGLVSPIEPPPRSLRHPAVLTFHLPVLACAPWLMVLVGHVAVLRPGESWAGGHRQDGNCRQYHPE